MARSSLFDSADGCPAYQACREHYTKRPAREALEAAWERTAQWTGDDPADVHSKLRKNFHPTAWEIYLRDVLLRGGLTLERTKPEGPDLCVRLADGERLWIEAVSAGPGDRAKADSVHSWREHGGTSGALYRIEPLLMRVTNALETKLAVVVQWQRTGVIATNEPVLIALNHGEIWDSDLHDEDGIPAVVKGVLGIGDYALALPLYGRGTPTPVLMERTRIRKMNGATVATTLFRERRSSPISGLLFARQLMWNLRWDASRDLRLLHNPMAQTPLQRGVIPTHCELWVEGDELVHAGDCDRAQATARDWKPRRVTRPSKSADQASQSEQERVRAMSPRERALLALRLGSRG